MEVARTEREQHQQQQQEENQHQTPEDNEIQSSQAIIDIEPAPLINPIDSETSKSISNSSENQRQVHRSSDSSSSKNPECRICLLTDSVSKLVKPCACDGSLQYCHYKCLKKWVKESKKLKCEICGAMYTKELMDKLDKTVAKAEKRDQERRDAMLSAQLGAIADSQNDYENYQAKKIECRVILFVLICIILVYIVLFLSKNRHFSAWTVLILKVFSFVLPFYLVGRGIVALQQCRRSYEQRAIEEYVV